jgi:hypothetical protein
MRSSITAFAILFVAALGCVERIYDSDDRTATLQEDLRLDANAEDFPSIGRLFVGPRGEIAVPLPQDRKLAVYDSSGKRTRTLGRRGPGPGEFEGIGSVGWIADTIWVTDPRVRRTTYFAPDGTVLRVVGLPAGLAQFFVPAAPVGSLTRVGVISVFADGSLLAEGYRLTADSSGKALGDHVIVRIGPTGEWRVLAIPPSFEDERWSMTAGGLGRSVPFAGWPQFATSSDGRWFGTLGTDSQTAEGGKYTLSVFRANGDTVFIRSYPFRGEPIPRSVADSAAAAENRPATEGPSNVGAMFERIAREKMPPVYPPVQWFILGLDDTIWITLRDSADVRTTLVLDARGDQISSIVTSTRTRIRQADASRVWATEVDDDGLASVVRYRVHGIPCQPPRCPK